MFFKPVLLAIVLAPLIGALISGLFGRQIGRSGAHIVTISGVAISCMLSGFVLWQLMFQGVAPFNENIYTWFDIGGFSTHIGFMVDKLSALMMVVVTFVSLLVHMYTIGYMSDDPGYQRFFSYISLFTFSMLMLVMANNFLQLFFGWEAVGLVSYLLIGFWFNRPTAIFANLKAFLVNRVGDFGFLLGIAAVFYWFETLDYASVFANAPLIAQLNVSIIGGYIWAVPTVICVCLFVGAMGKSAQVPLHVWLPDSMEGPTPISALIHAATMVTAGIFMVARMSPLFELSETALHLVLFIGATTAFFTGLISIVQDDIKRVIAYSTLSQLGYMTVALGISAYSAAIYHLMAHAFFKALLFLAAGSVIIGMHHEQNMRKMGGLWKYMPITFWTSLIGALALVGTPFFSGFYSKDTIVEAAKLYAYQTENWIASYGYWSVLLGAFVTALYIFRLLYLTFFGEERFRKETAHGFTVVPHESPYTVTIPLIILAFFSLVIGFVTVGPMLFSTDIMGNKMQLPFFLGAIDVTAQHAVIAELGSKFHGPISFALHGFLAPVFWLTLLGFVVATIMYYWKPELPTKLRGSFLWLIRILEAKFWFDALWIRGFANSSLRLAGIARKNDEHVIDGFFVNGSVRLIGCIAHLIRRTQSGYLYHYAFAMILGLILALSVVLLR